MTPEQLQALRDALIAGKVPDEKTSPERAFLRGWNEGVAFAEMQIDKILKAQINGDGGNSREQTI
jgi:uncharacterized protein YeaC (DUF1315 family)